MKNLSKLFLMVLLLVFAHPVFADENEADLPPFPSEEVEPGTIPFHNVIEVRNFLLLMSESDSEAMEIALAIQTQLDEKDIHVHSTRDIIGGYNAEGRTYRTTRQSFRSDRILPNRAITFLQNDSTSDFALGFRLLNVIVHEYYHYKDYRANRLGRSPEGLAYQRAYNFMFNVYWKYLLSEALVFEQRTPNVHNFLKDRLQIFTLEMSREMNGYDEDDHGPLEKFSAPEAFKGCVRSLTRQELTLAMRDFSGFLNGKSVSHALDQLEKRMRFNYPTDDPNLKCVTSISDSGFLDLNQPVGHGGPRQPHLVFTVDLPANHSLVVEKVSNQSNIYVEAGEVIQTAGLKKFNRKGTLYSWENARRFEFEKGGPKHIFVVSSQETTTPISFNVKFKGSYMNENNQEVVYDLQSRQLSLAENTAFGYYPIDQKLVAVLLSDRSLGSPDHFHRQEAIEFTALQNDYLRMHLPAFEERTGVLYKVTGQMGHRGLPELERLQTIYSWTQTVDYKVETSGKYLFVVLRHQDNLDNLRFNFNIQVSRNGTIPPTQMSIRRLNREENATYGFHIPSIEKIVVHYDHTQPSGYWGPFKSQAILDLDVLPGDRLQFTDLGEHLNRTVHLVRLENDQFIHEESIYSWQSSAVFHILKNARYYLIFGQNEEFAEKETSTLHIRRWRHSRQGPNEAKIKWLTADQHKALGYHEYLKSDFVVHLNADSPEGFKFEKQKFQSYEVTGVLKDARIKLISANPAIPRRIYLFQVNEDAFAQNLPCLKVIATIYSWNQVLDHRFEDPGRYVLVMESDVQNQTGDIPIQLYKSQKGLPAESIKIREMSLTEMKDRRYRPL